jgi:hypothetical protein
MPHQIISSHILALAAIGLPLTALADRPLAVDEAGVSPKGDCYLETWAEHSRVNGRAEPTWAAAPACVIADGLELGLEFGVPTHSSRGDGHRGLALKLVPESAQWGNWHFGARFSIGSERAAGTSGWADSPYSLLGIATWQASETLAVHVNLGVDHEQQTSRQTGNGGVALAWMPHAHWLVFAELTGAERSTATRGAGLRHWVIPEVLGLDFTVSRSNAVRDSTTFTVGLGWYGIKF